jgi:hypothetical protein
MKSKKIKQKYSYQYKSYILTAIIVLLPIISSLLMYDKDNIKAWLSNFHIIIFMSTITLLASILIYTCSNDSNKYYK